MAEVPHPCVADTSCATNFFAETDPLSANYGKLIPRDAIDPDPCNVLECRPGVLFVPGRADPEQFPPIVMTGAATAIAPSSPNVLVATATVNETAGACGIGTLGPTGVREVSGVVAKAQTTILAGAEEAFDAIVQADKITTYFPDRASGDLRTGSTIIWEFDHAHAKVELRVLEQRRPTRILFEWNAAQAGFKPVEFRLSPSHAATRIEVMETGYNLSADDVAKAIQQTNGWAEFLALLKARLQFDIELRAGRQK